MAKKPTRESSREHERAESSSGAENTKEALLEAGKRLFARQGYDGTTIKDLSEAAGVNISLVSYHFQGKEGLYRACLEQFGKSRLSVAERVLQTSTSVEEFKVRLQMFIDEMLNWYRAEPELCLMIQRECDSGLPIAEDIFEGTYLKIFERLRTFVSGAQKHGAIRADVDPQIACSLLFGCLTSITRTDSVGERFFGVTIKDPKYEKKVKEQILPIFLEGLVKDKNRESEK